MAYYFASDIHLGLKYRDLDPDQREKIFVAWLESIASDCEKLFLVGDIFDFWYEWRRVAPRGYIRTLGQLRKMSDNGIEIHLMVGNHDLWAGEYLNSELGINVHTSAYIFESGEIGKKFYIAHGHAQGKHDFMGRCMLTLFNGKFSRWIFSHIFHPNCAMKLGTSWSNSSRHSHGNISHTFKGENERLVSFAREYITKEPIDLFVFGHLHTPIIYPLNNSDKLIVLGEWILNPVYGRIESQNGAEFELLEFSYKS